jgi:hypothetical protein
MQTKKSFKQAINLTKKFTKSGHIDEARMALHEAWALVEKDAEKRKIAHDMGNQIQAAIFAKYLGE